MEHERERERGTNLLGTFHVGDADAGRALFAGRRREIDLLHAALDRSSEGQGRLVLLSGGRGIGKTRTATELARHAKHQGFTVLWARCPQGEAAPRFGPWAQILEQCLYGLDQSSLPDLLRDAAPGLAGVLPAIRHRLGNGSAARAGAAPQGDFDFFDDVARLLAEVARRTPQVVVLDDLESADADSRQFLQFLTRRLHDLPLLVLATYCEEGLGTRHPLFDALVELGRAPATAHLDLHGLSSEEIGLLAARAAGAALGERDIATLWQCTGGNPLFALELLRALGTEGLRDLPENGLRIVPVTPEVRAIVSRRLMSLPDACRRTLRVAATIGYHFPAALVAAVVAEQEDDGDCPIPRSSDIGSIDAFLDEGVVANAVRPMCKAPGCYRFSDWFTMNTLRQEVPVADRAGLQRRIAQVIDRENAPIPCLTEWTFQCAAGHHVVGDTVCLRHCEHASLFASLPPPLAEPDAGETAAAITAALPRAGALRKEGDYWTVSFGCSAEQIKESRGLVYLSHLLRHPRRAFLAVELVELAPGTGGSFQSNDGLESYGIGPSLSSSAEPMMDAQANSACRQRLADLHDDLAEAESRNDLGRVEWLRNEVEQLLSLWGKSLGLGGRARPLSPSASLGQGARALGGDQAHPRRHRENRRVQLRARCAPGRDDRHRAGLQLPA